MLRSACVIFGYRDSNRAASIMLADRLPIRRKDLIVREVRAGAYVVKVAGDRSYFEIGAAEEFLLSRLDGTFTPEELCLAFETALCEPLALSELDEFIALVRSWNLLDEREHSGQASSAESPASSDSDRRTPRHVTGRKQQSLLHFRIPLFDPTAVFGWAEPKLRFVWTPSFVACGLILVGIALLIAVGNSAHLAESLTATLRWETILVAWAVVVGATLLHECAHGLTCKHFGGEVPEIGAMMLLFMPCLYCDVSDAWLIPKRSQRLWITLAGTCSDICLWALATIVWRLTVPHTTPHYLSAVVVGVCGGRVALNLNPLLRLDGYYLLSDWLEIPNLRIRAHQRWMQLLRATLWGGPRLEFEDKGSLLLLYGAASWTFGLVFLSWMYAWLSGLLGGWLGTVGTALAIGLVAWGLYRSLDGILGSEFKTMLWQRHRRTAFIALLIAGFAFVSLVIPMRRSASGEFEVRPIARHEIHVPLHGYVRAVHVYDGSAIRAGDLILELDAPDLKSELAAKRAQLRKLDAIVAELRTGARSEALVEQRAKVKRLYQWCSSGEDDLEQAHAVLDQDLRRLDNEVRSAEIEVEYARRRLTDSEYLYSLGALAGQQLRLEQKRLDLLQSQLDTQQAMRAARQAEGVQTATAELDRRRHELADAEAALKLLEAGTRAEELEAELAHREQIQEEVMFLESQCARLSVRAPISGTICAPRLQERIGQLITPETTFCAIEDVERLQIEIAVPEEELDGIQRGQPVRLKARAMPFETVVACVDRISPATAAPAPTKARTVTVYCTIANSEHRLKPGMSGSARIAGAPSSLATVALGDGLQYLRTEFWW